MNEHQNTIPTKVFQYYWKQLVADQYVSEENTKMKKSLYSWFLDMFRKNKKFLSYTDIVLHLGGHF
jgi:putative lipase involved disintegration of autophagic bodies